MNERTVGSDGGAGRIRNVVVLGATGSIGVNALDVLARFPDRFNVIGLAAGRNVDLLTEQVKRFKPQIAAVLTEDLADRLRDGVNPDWDLDAAAGEEAYIRLAALPEADIVISAMVGAAGLRPTWAAVRSGKRVALANKETLVMAGEAVMKGAKEYGAEILPVDSEHSAIFQALAGQDPVGVKRLILTASGGPFRDWPKERLHTVTVDEALNHPNWKMGPKISVDSSTLMNKGLECIEASRLFGLPMEKIDIHVHPQSIIHSLVEFIDGSLLAQLGAPDMRLPIVYALSYPERLDLDAAPLDLTQSKPLTFSNPDLVKFPCLALALEAGRMGGVLPAVLNAANEVAVAAFLDGRLSYMGISETVRRVVENFPPGPLDDIEQAVAADRQARQAARSVIESG